MPSDRMDEIMRSSIEGIQSITDMNTLVGRAINTPSGITVIPVSKVSMGFASGGVDISGKKSGETKNFGGGGGSTVTVTPISFLTIDKSGSVNLIPVNGEKNSVDKIASIIERAPEIIDKIKRITK